jgi:radical SAM superfamily enzyme YgiQ (UPF0313 family)
MEIRKIRFVEPGNLPYRRTVKNAFTYDEYLRNPSIGMLTLATWVHERYADTFMYSESISEVKWEDVLDADVVFLGIFTFNADRGYELAEKIRRESKAMVVMGGLHATLSVVEAAVHCDYVLMGDADDSILTFLEAAEKDEPDTVAGLAYYREGLLRQNQKAEPPLDIDIIPDRNLLYRYNKMASHNTLWAQVHASRGCPHNCDYCAVVQHFGRKVRTRTPSNIVEDIKQSIAFHERGFFPRVSKVLWLTDDNFFADREWAKAVLNKIIESGIKYNFTVQARHELGFDDEMLDLLKKAGFFEVAIGIEFVDDRSFEKYHKRCTVKEMEAAIANIQKHGLSVRGLFIVGTEDHEKGVGRQVTDFVLRNNIKGVLIQSMYFVPGTVAYENHKDKLIYDNWKKCNGSVVHNPVNMTPAELQEEIIDAIESIYSVPRLILGIIREPKIYKVLMFGEFMWQRSVRRRLIGELPELRELGRKK